MEETELPINALAFYDRVFTIIGTPVRLLPRAKGGDSDAVYRLGR